MKKYTIHEVRIISGSIDQGSDLIKFIDVKTNKSVTNGKYGFCLTSEGNKSIIDETYRTYDEAKKYAEKYHNKEKRRISKIIKSLNQLL